MTMRQKASLDVHVYVDDGQPERNWRDTACPAEGRCRTCGLPRANRRHGMPATPSAAAELEARRYPEPEETDDDQELF